LLKHQAPVINGDGSYSRDFTFIDNVIQANELAAATPLVDMTDRLAEYGRQGQGTEDGGRENPESPHTSSPEPRTSVSEVFNIAYGGNTTLNELYSALRENLALHDPEIESLKAIYGPNRSGDIPHSMASIDKAKMVLGYEPKFDAKQGFEKACGWYFENLKG
jgi:UDP-N-acetylglucosamine 4-epimerase